MVERRICNFSGEEIEPGTGVMYVKRDGTVLSVSYTHLTLPTKA